MPYNPLANTTNYPGTTDNNKFKWVAGFGNSDAEGEDLALLRDQVKPTVNLFTKILAQVRAFMTAYDTAIALVNTVRARELNNFDKGPPYPLEGELAPVKSGDLEAAMLVQGLLIAWMSTPIDVNQGQGTPLMVTPDTILRRLT